MGAAVGRDHGVAGQRPAKNVDHRRRAPVLVEAAFGAERGPGRGVLFQRPSLGRRHDTVRKDQAETSVLFELISARYERRSLLITAKPGLRRMEQGVPGRNHRRGRRRPAGPPWHQGSGSREDGGRERGGTGQSASGRTANHRRQSAAGRQISISDSDPGWAGSALIHKLAGLLETLIPLPLFILFTLPFTVFEFSELRD